MNPLSSNPQPPALQVLVYGSLHVHICPELVADERTPTGQETPVKLAKKQQALVVTKWTDP
jgi:hypothetical protein